MIILEMVSNHFQIIISNGFEWFQWSPPYKMVESTHVSNNHFKWFRMVSNDFSTPQGTSLISESHFRPKGNHFNAFPIIWFPTRKIMATNNDYFKHGIKPFSNNHFKWFWMESPPPQKPFWNNHFKWFWMEPPAPYKMEFQPPAEDIIHIRIPCPTPRKWFQIISHYLVSKPREIISNHYLKIIIMVPPRPHIQNGIESCVK